MILKNRILIFLAFALLLSGCATAPPRVTTEEVDLGKICSHYDIQWKFDSVSQLITLTRTNLTAKVLLGSALVVIGSEQITLSAPLKRAQGNIVVPYDFKKKVIDRLILQAEAPARKFKKIVVDPGHGGKDPGAIGISGLREKIVVLDIAKRLKKSLERRGIDVVMTRDSDEFISLEKRAELAQKAKADLFISVHANASRARSSRGFEVYYLRGLNEADKRDVYAAKNYKELFEQISMKRNSSALEKIILDMMYSYKQLESRKIADYIARNTADAIDAKDRGSRSAGFFVLKNTVIPAVLIEVGFLSNRQEEDFLKESSYRQKIAENLAKSIMEYAND